MPHHAFTPILHQTATILPVPHAMGPQDSSFNMHLQRAASRSSFSPATAFHPATQSFSSPKGRWAALHVRIAWKIYYNKKFKRIPQKPNSVYGSLTPECPSGPGLTDSEPWQVSDQPSCTHPHPELPCGESGVRSELRKTVHRFSRCHPSDLHASSPALCHNLPTHQREEAKPHSHEKPDGKDKHAVHQADMVEGSPLRDRSREQSVSVERQVRQSGSLNRKRQLEHDVFIEAKRLKKEPLDDTLDSSKTFQTDPSWFSMSQTHSSLTTPGHHRNTGHLPVFYPNSSTALGGPPSCPGPDIIPYQAAPRELLWNRREHLHSRQSILKEHSLRPTEAFTGFFMPPLYFLSTLGVQEASYLSGREFLHAQPENCHPHPCRSQLPYPGFLTTSC